MTPKARRQQQLTRETASRSETEAAITEFKAGRRGSRRTQLASRRKTRKNSARCYGCDATGFPLEVWEYEEVVSGPAILCNACAAIAERDFDPRGEEGRRRAPSGTGERGARGSGRG